jgi:uncharacterized protein YndB with AHSA1/START domain
MTETAITVAATRDTISASAVVPAPPAAVFDFLRRPANHPALSGDHSVRGTRRGPEVLGEGDRFGMDMRIVLPYRVTSKVVEFDQDRRIAWCHLGGHRWRWELEPDGDGSTRVTETFDLSTALLPAALRLAGYPGKHRDNISGSLRRLVEQFGGEVEA